MSYTTYFNPNPGNVKGDIRKKLADAVCPYGMQVLSAFAAGEQLAAPAVTRRVRKKREEQAPPLR